MYVFTISMYYILLVRNIIKRGNRKYCLILVKTKASKLRLLSWKRSECQVNDSGVAIKAMVCQTELSHTWAGTECKAVMNNPLGKSNPDFLAPFPSLPQVLQPEVAPSSGLWVCVDLSLHIFCYSSCIKKKKKKSPHSFSEYKRTWGLAADAQHWLGAQCLLLLHSGPLTTACCHYCSLVQWSPFLPASPCPSLGSQALLWQAAL